MTRCYGRAVGLAVALAIASFAAWGCGETGDTDPTPVQTFKIKPAANATELTDATAEPSEPTVEPEPTGGPGGSTTITIAAVGSVFDPEEIEAPAGTITIEFDNRDGGVIHNLHFYKGSDSDGESVAETDLETGPVKQTLVFDTEPGEYYYMCDVHPTTMEGTLTAE